MKTTFAEVNLVKELKYVSFLLRNSEYCNDIPIKFFLNEKPRNIIKAIQKLHEKNIKCTIDELLLFTSVFDSLIDKQQLLDIFNGYDDFSNIEFLKREIKETHLKHNINKSILEDILVNVSSAGELEYDKLKQLGNDLLYNLSEIDDKIKLKSAKELGEDYKKELEKRKLGQRKRSLGFKPLDENITRPGQDGEMTGLVALKGMVKSIFTKSIENHLINRRIPVLSLNPEMSQLSSTDRLIAMRGRFTLGDLLRQEKDKELEEQLGITIARLSANPYYEFSDESFLTLDDIDSLIYKARSKFREKGIFKDKDEYIFVTIDLLEMVEEFSNLESAYGVKRSINKLHQITKKHGCHIFYVLQANENKIRSTKFRKPEDLDFYKVGLEDVYGGDGYAGRARVMFSLQRPKHLRMMFFPERNEEWSLEQDIINCNCIKQNDGKLFFTQFVFDDYFTIRPLLKESDNNV